MTAIGDDEDGLPHERVASRELPTMPFSEAPPPLEHFTEAQEAPTLPPPPVDEALAAAVAGMVIAALGPQLNRVEKEVMDLRTKMRDAEPIIAAIDRGVGKALGLFVEASVNIERIADAIGPREESQPPIFESLRNLATEAEGTALDVDAIRRYLLGKGATIHELQRAEENRHPMAASGPDGSSG